ncbi:MAG: hypothetical protein LC777_08020, partial [Actinobacteria bacterium]|nr:hypothetical protein [Actinomycetota bacterium]
TLVVVVILALLGSDDDATDMNVAEARASLRALHRRTAASVAPASMPEVMADRLSTCYSGIIVRDLGTQYATFSLAVPVEAGSERDVLEKVIVAWERKGIKLGRTRLDHGDAEVGGGADGYTVRALAVRGTGQVALTGATDCLDPPPGPADPSVDRG